MKLLIINLDEKENFNFNHYMDSYLTIFEYFIGYFYFETILFLNLNKFSYFILNYFISLMKFNYYMRFLKIFD